MKQNRYMRNTLGICVLALAAALTVSCSAKTDSAQDAPAQTEDGAQAGGTQSAADSGDTAAAEYKDRELDADWSEDDATVITCREKSVDITGEGAVFQDGTITISRAGTYVISGALTDGHIEVDADKEDWVRIVLNGVDISCPDGAAISGVQSEEIILTLADGTVNTISDGTEYTLAAGEDEPNAAIFSKDDLCINGGGTLNVYGNYNHGVFSKDDLILVSGKISVECVADGLKGKDSVLIREADITVTAGRDGIKSNNDTDEGKGYIVIDGGNVSVAAEDDGIHAEAQLVINGGIINVAESYEGLEGKSVLIQGGEIRVKSSDDGINAAGGSDGEPTDHEQDSFHGSGDNYIRITAGDVYVEAGGDGIDSNGNLYVDGGALYVDGPEDDRNGALDYEGEALITGGTVVAVGGAGMAAGFSENSGQGSVLVYFSEQKEAGTEISLADEAGNVLVSYTPKKAYGSAVISAPGITSGGAYVLSCGGSELCSLTLSKINGSFQDDGSEAERGGMGAGHMRGGSVSGQPGRRAEGEGRERAGDGQGEPPSGEKPQGEPPSGEMPTGEPPSGERTQGEPPAGAQQEKQAAE